MSEKLSALPPSLKVKIVFEDGVYIAELVDLGVFTEADSPEELDLMINDLIFTYFEVPKKYQADVRYAKKKLGPINVNTSVFFGKYINQDAGRVFCS